MCVSFFSRLTMSLLLVLSFSVPALSTPQYDYDAVRGSLYEVLNVCEEADVPCFFLTYKGGPVVLLSELNGRVPGDFSKIIGFPTAPILFSKEESSTATAIDGEFTPTKQYFSTYKFKDAYRVTEFMDENKGLTAVFIEMKEDVDPSSVFGSWF